MPDHAEERIWNIRISSSTAGSDPADAFSTFLAQFSTGDVIAEITAGDSAHPNHLPTNEPDTYTQFDQLKESNDGMGLGLCGLGLIELALEIDMTAHDRLSLKNAVRRLAENL